MWIAIGFVGQICFGARFLVQWICSERKGKSYVPTAFWYLSIVGSIILFSYAVYKQDPVFIVGQSMGIIIYLRNLILIRKNKKEAAEKLV